MEYHCVENKKMTQKPGLMETQNLGFGEKSIEKKSRNHCKDRLIYFPTPLSFYKYVSQARTLRTITRVGELL